MASNTNPVDRLASRKALTVTEVFTEADLPAPSAGVITLPAGVYSFRAQIITANRFALTAGANITLQAEDVTQGITYTGTGTLFSEAGAGAGIFALSGVRVIMSGVGAQIFDLTSDVVSMRVASIIAVAAGVTIGTFDGGVGAIAALLNLSQIIGVEGGLTVDNYPNFTANDVQFGFIGMNAATAFSLGAGLGDISMQTVLVGAVGGGTEKVFDINSGFVGTSRIVNVLNPDGLTFFAVGGLDEKSPSISVQDSPPQKSSKNIACAYVNNNATVVGPIVNNVFTDLVFGIVSAALIECANIERWALVDEVNGILEYQGLEPFDGAIGFTFSAVSSGGSQEFRFKWQKDTGGGFVDLVDDVQTLIDVGNTAAAGGLTVPLQANTGDQIKPQVTRNAGSSGLTVLYFSVNVS